MADATILVIDDNADNLRVAVDHLEQAGYEARAARSGESGLKRAAHGAAQLILLDVEMPGWDGFETCRRLKADPATADIPVIFMTSHRDVEMKVQALAAGGVDYVTKPFEPPELLARVRTHLRIAELQSELAARNAALQELSDNLAKRVEEQVHTIRERATEVERLNAQLRTQVQERSLALSRALQRLARRTEANPSVEGMLLDGRYRVEVPLAQGGQGAVFLGKDERTGQDVAIKLIRAGLVGPHLAGRFLREASLAASVDHPAVVRMLHVDIHDDGMLYQVQELALGEPLDTARKRIGNLSVGATARILEHLAAALQAVHGAGVVHRDLKPANVILTPEAPGLKLVDFGIAKRSAQETWSDDSDGETEQTLTRPGMLVGTPRYMSPEQRMGIEATAASDVFALGVLAHLVASGEHLSSGWQLKPGGLERLARACVRPEPQARPTAADVEQRAHAVAEGLGTPPLHILVTTDTLRNP